MFPILRSYSPYHNLHPDKKYPEIFFITSTTDDRVHPGHARKMAHKMKVMGKKIYFYENIEGGHGRGTTIEEQAKMSALSFSYLWKKLM